MLPDAQGSVRNLTDATGTVTDTYRYTAYGELYAQNGPTTNNYLYTGQQYDSLTGLYSLRARYYDPSIGRFLTRDTWPLDTFNPVELNRYQYGMSNPVTFSDPSGHQALAEFTSSWGLVTIVLALLVVGLITPNQYLGGQTPIYYFISNILEGLAPPDIKMPDIKIPDIIPDIKIPDIGWPDIELPGLPDGTDNPDYPDDPTSLPGLPDEPRPFGFPAPYFPDFTPEDAKAFIDRINRIINGDSGNDDNQNDGDSGGGWGRVFWKAAKWALGLITGGSILGGDSGTTVTPPDNDDENRRTGKFVAYRGLGAKGAGKSCQATCGKEWDEALSLSQSPLR